ncbi:GGDEF domain-containing protein [Paenibacillus cymbidii]|uniref:GGDEF domain-containing protein n=1 Tax=Paenibacillus cymbidii TaxID=1639034 RepID=UPI0010811F8A|nr:GGDEF domain-containing protein [Paenibacillus cymbidii]
MTKRVDSLTGLQNNEEFEQDLKAAIAKEDAVGLASLDVDHFDVVNEQFGHETGDVVLKAIAESIKAAGVGQAYRISGDEYAILLPGASLEQAFLKMESLRAAVHANQSAYGLPADAGKEITVTIGVAQYPRDAKEASALRRAADAALASAKESGRNLVALPPSEDMIMKSCYYPASMIRSLKSLADKSKKKESHLLREALGDLIRKYDRIAE